MPVVYIATNIINGKSYIGATKHTLERRRNKHISDARNNGFCRAFYAAIRRYGPEKFEWRVLKEFHSIEQAFAHEVLLIASMKPEYNITSGGQGLIGVSRTPEWGAKIAVANKGKKRSLAQRAVSLAVLEKGRRARSRAVMCLNDGNKFDRIKDAAEFYGIPRKCVDACLCGTSIQTKGLSFSFIPQNGISETQRVVLLSNLHERKCAAEAKTKAGMRSRPVICVNSGTVFPNGRAAADYYGVSPATISLLISGKTVSRIGLKFKLAEMV